MNEQQFQQEVKQLIEERLRIFNQTDQVSCKIRLIARHLESANIDCVVMGVSGGIDSAVVFALLCQVKQRYLPNLKIHGYCITFDNVYGNIFDHKYVDLLKDKFCRKDVSITTIDCSRTIETLFCDLDLDLENKHLLAQSSYALRYQMLFTYAQKHGAVTFGTTNKSEFEYVGWFGKHSDMVVDFQCITNWYKSEVVQAAKTLEVPTQIIERVPTGDLIDNTSDEDNFGCSYDELECLMSSKWHNMFLYGGAEVRQFYQQKYVGAHNLHHKNIHKYQDQTFNPIFIGEGGYV